MNCKKCNNTLKEGESCPCEKLSYDELEERK